MDGLVDVKLEDPSNTFGMHTPATSCKDTQNCYLPCTAFRKCDGTLVCVEDLVEGTLVRMADGTESNVISKITYPRQSYLIAELSTRRGALKVGACHRVVVDADGTARAAQTLQKGDNVFMGQELWPLTRHPRIYEECTELFGVCLHLDKPIESILLPARGMQTLGDLVPPWQISLAAISKEELVDMLENSVPTYYEE